jgi:hypothetical protein
MQTGLSFFIQMAFINQFEVQLNFLNAQIKKISMEL